MSTLQDRLDRIKAGFMDKASDEVKTVMANATESIRQSGIMDRIPATGTLLPAFSLPDTTGNPVDSDTLLSKGPLVLTFYRGVW
jgi:hypothetical protein